MFEGQTLGTPICILVRNEDARPEAYADMRDVYRPSHADYTYEAKYGIRNWQGGGRASARETIGRVAAGAIARKVLAKFGVGEVVGFVSQVHTIEAKVDPFAVARADVERSITRCPDPAAAEEMIRRIDDARRAGDSLGGVGDLRGARRPARARRAGLRQARGRARARRSCRCRRARASRSARASRARGCSGSEHNDAFVVEDGRVRTRTNRSGGVQGGISNGEPILVRVAFKPTATIRKEQDTVNREGEAVKLEAQGRHDPCVLPRAVPMVEAMVALVLCDHLLRQRAISS